MIKRFLGWTMVERIIFAVIVLIAGLLVFSAGLRCFVGNDGALGSAQEWAKDMPGTTSVKCAATDTDHDGYISCTVFREDKDPLFIECGDGIIGSGCRAPKLRPTRW